MKLLVHDTLCSVNLTNRHACGMSSGCLGSTVRVTQCDHLCHLHGCGLACSPASSVLWRNSSLQGMGMEQVCLVSPCVPGGTSLQAVLLSKRACWETKPTVCNDNPLQLFLNAAVPPFVYRLDGRKYAVKKIKLQPNGGSSHARILREVATLSRLQHPNIVRYFQVHMRV